MNRHPIQIAILIVAVGVFFTASPVLAGSICSGFECLPMYGFIYFPYFFGVTLILFLVLHGFKVRVWKSIFISLAAAFVAILLYHNFFSFWLRASNVAEQDAANLKNFKQTIYQPTFVPESFRITETRVSGSNNNILTYEYKGKTNSSIVLQEFSMPAYVQLTPPVCSISSKGSEFEIFDKYLGVSQSSLQGKCAALNTPNGTKIYLMENRTTEGSQYFSRFAFMQLNQTFVLIRYGDSRNAISEKDLISLVDSLKPVSPSEVKIKVTRESQGY